MDRRNSTDDARQLLEAECGDTANGCRPHIQPQTAGRTRGELDPPNIPRQAPFSLTSQFVQHTQPLNGRHLLWTGKRTWEGTPVLAHGGLAYAPRQVAYFIQHSRWPVGQALPRCGQRWCMAPEHVADTVLRMQDPQAICHRPALPTDHSHDPVTAVSWETLAACADQAPLLWDADRANRQSTAAAWEARAICRTCPVKEQCLDAAMRTELGLGRTSRAGIRGGLDGDERFAREQRLTQRETRSDPHRDPVAQHGVWGIAR